MKYRVVILPTAKVELREAYRWYYNKSPSAAEKWLARLLKAVETLSQYPERCARAPEDDAFEERIRQLLYGKKHGIYRILFTVKEGVVHVLHIRHASQPHLDPDEI